jgi:hypothetical protein
MKIQLSIPARIKAMELYKFAEKQKSEKIFTRNWTNEKGVVLFKVKNFINDSSLFLTIQLTTKNINLTIEAERNCIEWLEKSLLPFITVLNEMKFNSNFYRVFKCSIKEYVENSPVTMQKICDSLKFIADDNNLIKKIPNLHFYKDLLKLLINDKENFEKSFVDFYKHHEFAKLLIKILKKLSLI